MAGVGGELIIIDKFCLVMNNFFSFRGTCEYMYVEMK